MLRLNLFSDTHYSHHRGGAAAYYDSFPPLDIDEFDATAVLGDCGNPAMEALEHVARHHTRGGKPCIYVPGNHDYYRGLDGSPYARTYVEEQTAIAAAFCRENGITYLSQFTGQIVTVVDGIRCVGLTGWPEFARELIPSTMSLRDAMSLSQKGYTEDGFGMFDRRSYHNDFREIRVGKGNADHRLTPRQMITWAHEGAAMLDAALSAPWDGETVLLTHVGPASLITPGDHAWLYGSRLTQDRAFEHGVSTWCSGHTHRTFDLEVDGVRCISNARGYPGENPRFDPRLVVEVGGPKPTPTFGV